MCPVGCEIISRPPLDVLHFDSALSVERLLHIPRNASALGEHNPVLLEGVFGIFCQFIFQEGHAPLRALDFPAQHAIDDVRQSPVSDGIARRIDDAVGNRRFRLDDLCRKLPNVLRRRYRNRGIPTAKGMHSILR